MSFMARICTKIKNLDVFKQVCEKHQIDAVNGQGKYQGQDIALKLLDKLYSGSNANETLVVKDSQERGSHNLVIDNDRSYSSLTRRLGPNGGILMRDYAEEMFNQELTQQGAMITDRQVQKDKSLVLRVAFSQ